MASWVFFITQQFARKSHTCWWCGDSITPGEFYHRWRYREGDIVTVKCHDDCKVAWEMYVNTFGDDGVVQGTHHHGCCCIKNECHCQE